MFESFILEIKEQLKQTLPGEGAQNRMAPAGRLSTRQYLKTNFNPSVSGVVLLLYPVHQIPFSVLILRPLYKGIHSGQVGLPGGKMEEKDPDIIHTALRELEEETGIRTGDVRIIGALSPVYIPVSHALVHPFVACSMRQALFNPDRKEVEQLIEFHIESLLQDSCKKEKEVLFGSGKKLSVPCYEIKNQVVWGATAMILSEFESMLYRVKLKEK